MITFATLTRTNNLGVFKVSPLQVTAIFDGEFHKGSQIFLQGRDEPIDVVEKPDEVATILHDAFQAALQSTMETTYDAAEQRIDTREAAREAERASRRVPGPVPGPYDL